MSVSLCWWVCGKAQVVGGWVSNLPGLLIPAAITGCKARFSAGETGDSHSALGSGSVSGNLTK